MLDYNNYTAHVIRDVFPHDGFVLLYGDHYDLKKTLRTQTHSIGAFMMHSSSEIVSSADDCKYWEIGINNPHINYRSVDLFISLNYKLDVDPNRSFYSAVQVKSLLNKKGLAFIVNPGTWALKMQLLMKRNSFLESEIKRYSLFKNEEIFVYENL